MSDTTTNSNGKSNGDGGQGVATGDPAAVPVQISPQELGAQLDQAVRRAVGQEVGALAKDIAKQALKDVLTAELLAGMAQTATQAASEALSTEPPAPEPEPETQFPNAAAWVEGWLVGTYRREVSKPRSEEDFRWCPQWWEHPEAACRFEEMWRSWEHLRQGKDVQMSQWWRDHADHHMAQLLDPKGPFIHCSVAKGHSPKLVPLPLGVVDAAVIAPVVATERTESGLHVVRAHPAREVITEFPEWG
ncbi:DUF4913 domain-containing protein [Nocardia otitidiscaviarum]|uniref:DUF4913 domain-containing protein n=1 Tax=Nocardia otitidiscaviarum TaxID=1823 RepID=UPI0020CB789F|nr:DUF4913 domain-containing protein [Nocardia otitidiscaviarum]MCP9625250.1 DUF4913 domain-containing protein [Nocardia otitidiscaviarum]